MTAPTIDSGFDFDLRSILPRLRVYAMALTRSPDRADDLVQQTAMKALAGRKSFQAGSNFAGWMFRIQRNEFISGLRRTHPTVELDLDLAHTVFHAPHQESGLVMREFVAAFRLLSTGAREALLLAEVEGYSHRQIAAHADISVGTVKSRISRGRAILRRLLDPEIADAGAPAAASQERRESTSRGSRPPAGQPSPCGP